MTRSSERGVNLLIACGVVAAVMLCAIGPALPKMVVDSPLYLHFSPIVPAGYPAFVALVGAGALVPVQALLFAVCATVLAVTVKRAWGSLPLSFAVFAAMLVNPQVLDFEQSMVSEALFLPVVMLVLAALVAYVARGRAGAALLCAALTGVGAAVRPISLPMIAAVLAVVLLRERSRRQHALLLAAGCGAVWIAVVGGEKAYSHWRQGNRLTSLTGLHLYAKASLLDAPPIDRRGLGDTERRLADAAETRYAPVRALLARSRGTVAYPALLAHYEICIQRDCTKDLRAASPLPEARFNDAMRHVGWLRARENPLGFLRLSTDEFRSLWVLASRTHPSRALLYDAYLASQRPLPLEGVVNPALYAPTPPSRVALLVRPAFILAGLATAAIVLVFGWLAAVRRRRDPALLAALGCALSVELVFAFTSVAGIGDGRYTMGMWPNMALGMLLGAYVAANGARRRRPGLKASG